MTSETTCEIDRLAECDKANLSESKRALLNLNTNSLAATDECAQLLENIGLSFGQACDYDKYNDQLNDWMKTQSGSAEEKFHFLEQATLIGQVGGTDPVAEAKGALVKACSVVARAYLLLRLRRDFLFGLTDLLRLRLTSAIGYLRVQTESIAILALLGGDSAMAVDWLNTCSRDEGKEFYKKYHRRIVEKLKELDLYDYYEDGSNMSLHSRVFGVAPGIGIGKKGVPQGRIKLTYQEVDDAVILFLWFCVYLRAHERMIKKLPEALPEVEFRKIEVRRYEEVVESLWSTLRPLYRQKRGKALPSFLS